MSRQPENTFIESVHRHMLQGKPYRMKNHNEYVGGIADVWYSGDETDLWVEYKFLRAIPRSDAIKLNLSDLQSKWLMDRLNEGRNVWVILGLPEGGIIFRGGEWNATWTDSQLVKKVIPREDVARWITEFAVGFYTKPAPRGKMKRIA